MFRECQGWPLLTTDTPVWRMGNSSFLTPVPSPQVLNAVPTTQVQCDSPGEVDSSQVRVSRRRVQSDSGWDAGDNGGASST